MHSKKYILAIDQSTSATKVMLFDSQANLVNRVSKAHEQYYPSEGFVEHDAEEIFSNTVAVMQEVLNQTNVNTSDVSAISITNLNLSV